MQFEHSIYTCFYQSHFYSNGKIIEIRNLENVESDAYVSVKQKKKNNDFADHIKKNGIITKTS